MSERKFWPTPTARLGTPRGAQAKRYWNPARSNDLDDAVAADIELRRSAASLPASEGSTSALSGPDGNAASRSNGTSSASESSPSTGPMFPDMETSTTSTERRSVLWPTPQAQMPGAGPDNAKVKNLLTGSRHSFYLTQAVEAERQSPGIITGALTASRPSTFSPAAFLVSPSRSQGSNDGWTTIVGYGPSSREPFASYDPATFSWRTSQASLWEAEWTPYSETWPTSGMTRSGRAFPRRPLVPRTSVTGSGSSLTGKETHHVPTPTASDHIARQSTPSEALNFETNKTVTLDRWVGRWPTPTSRDHKDSPAPRYRNGKLQTDTVGRAVWATPTAHPRTHTPRDVDHGEQLANQVGGALAPEFVEWLMGFPKGWTEL